MITPEFINAEAERVMKSISPRVAEMIADPMAYNLARAYAAIKADSKRAKAKAD